MMEDKAFYRVASQAASFVIELLTVVTLHVLLLRKYTMPAKMAIFLIDLIFPPAWQSCMLSYLSCQL